MAVKLVSGVLCLQEILGTYLRREQGLMKSFLQLRVEALRSADDGALDHLVKHLESRELGKGFEVEVFFCRTLQLCTFNHKHRVPPQQLEPHMSYVALSQV